MVAISTDPVEDAAKAAEAFPRLRFIADPERSLGGALEMVDPGALKPVERAVYGPTQVIVDGAGKIESLWRAPSVPVRRGVDAIIEAAGG